MRETVPTVRLIASPRIHWDEVQDYLNTIPVPEGALPAGDWYWRVHGDDDASRTADAELLIEFAGRGCYRSWAPGLNANVTKVREDSASYLENILRVRHGSVLEHAQFTFHFADVSRVFTHELVRHRAGVAISQESLRYVRLTDLGFRVPSIFDSPELEERSRYAGSVHDEIVSIVERLEEVQRDLAHVFRLDDEGVPFHVKKEVTSALRRLAPLGLSTSMTWSANVRTLRWLIEQRTAPDAEEEIRMVFADVARIMLRECPLLFGDFTLEHSDACTRRNFTESTTKAFSGHCDCVPMWVPEHSKV